MTKKIFIRWKLLRFLFLFLLPSFSYISAQVISSSDDFDGDGVSNLADIDDDNDGVSDAVESPSCFYTANEWNLGAKPLYAVTVSSELITKKANFSQLTDGIMDVTAVVFSDSPSQSVQNKSVYLFTFAQPVKLGALYLQFNTNTQFSGTTKIQGSNTNNGTDWIDLSVAESQSALTNTTLNGGVKVTNSIKYPVSINTDLPFKYIRITGDAASNITAQNASEVYFDFSAYIPSRYPKSGCTNDTDGDGVSNHFDLDSDDDGCFDKYEAGVTGATINGAYTDSLTVPEDTAGDVGSNGLSDSVERFPDNAVLNYSSTYTQYAVRRSIQSCKNTDGDGVYDINDIDDDNDGITDVAECPSGIKRTMGGTINLTQGLIGTQPSDVLNNKYGVIISETQKTYPYATTSDVFNVYPHALDSDGKVIFRPADIGYSFAFYDPFLNIKREQDVISITAEKATDGSLITLICFDLNGNIIYSNSALPDGQTYSVNTTMTVNNAKIHRFVVFGSKNTTAFDQLYVEALNYFIADCDTDNDKFANHLDLDSDGDNCPDAMEAGVADNPDASTAMSASGGNNYSGGINQGTANAYVGDGTSGQYGANGFFNAIETSS